MIRLVIAGSHQEYLNWLAAWGHSPAEYRPYDEAQVRGLRAVDIVSFDQVGTYWTHPGWGGPHYRMLMDEGLSRDLHWAMPWDADYLKAETLKAGRPAAPVRDEEIARAVARQRELEERFGPGA